MKLTIKRIQTRKELKEFVLFPWSVYKDDPYWVAPLINEEMKFLNKNKGAFFHAGEAEYFMAYDGQKPVGRISAHINFQYEKYHDKDTGFFGFFECIKNQHVADALLDVAQNWLSERKKTRILGPMSFSLYDTCGLLCDGYDSSPVILLSYNPDYYNSLISGAGFSKAIDWYAFMVNQDVPIKPSFYKIRERVLRQPNLRIETLDLKKLDSYVPHIGQIFKEAWMENWGHVPLTDSQLQHLVSELKLIVVPELTYLAFLNDECIGFSLSIKDANPALKKANGRLFPFGFVKILLEMKKITRLRTIAMGVLKEHRHRGIDIVFYLNTIENGSKLGFKDSECSIIVENNKRMISALEDLNAERYKTYRFFEKML